MTKTQIELLEDEVARLEEENRRLFSPLASEQVLLIADKLRQFGSFVKNSGEDPSLFFDAADVIQGREHATGGLRGELKKRDDQIELLKLDAKRLRDDYEDELESRSDVIVELQKKLAEVPAGDSDKVRSLEFDNRELHKEISRQRARATKLDNALMKREIQERGVNIAREHFDEKIAELTERIERLEGASDD